MEDKNFTTFERQIEILKSRDLVFISEEFAVRALRRYGYYNIINGYKDPYTEIIDGEEHYKKGVTFERIYSLYCLDRQIRNTVLDAMLEVEDTLRTATAHTIAEAFSAEQSLYLKRTNYRSGNSRNGEFPIDQILHKFNKIALDRNEPFKHYRETYNNVPPWILVKGASFGNIANFIKLQKHQQKDRIISLVYDFPIQIIHNIPAIRDLFMDTIFVCLDFRNIAAHGGRTYNHSGKSQFRYNPILHDRMCLTPADYRNGKGHSDLQSLVTALTLFDNSAPLLKLQTGIDFYYGKHLEKYPEDENYLSKYLSLNHLRIE